jgi:A/G-specific adenine glycosylase
MDELDGANVFIRSAWKRALATRLLKWFAGAARDLPWRRTKDLYAIWISEVMLQQTQVATVIPYWERFLKRFPDAAALAAADEQEVLRLWEGLGYYRRARQLHAAAGQIVNAHGGRFPATFHEVRELPGIGRYTAGAILSIGLDQRLPILEANSIRVLSRLTAFRGDPKSAAGQQHLWSIAEQILPPSACGAFNQALMELGSEVCSARAPVCQRCPVAELCAARRSGLVDSIPRSSQRKAYEEVTEVAVIVRERGHVLLRQCQSGERWAGLWDFPRFAAADEATLAEQIATRTRELAGVCVRAGERLATLKHSVTRFRIQLHCYVARRTTRSRRTAQTARWVALPDLPGYPLSTTGRKISRLLAN